MVKPSKAAFWMTLALAALSFLAGAVAFGRTLAPEGGHPVHETGTNYLGGVKIVWTNGEFLIFAPITHDSQAVHKAYVDAAAGAVGGSGEYVSVSGGLLTESRAGGTNTVELTTNAVLGAVTNLTDTLYLGPTDTNGFVDITITNGLGSGDGTLVATDTNGFVGIAITNGLGSGDGTLVATDTNGFVTATVTNGLGSGDGTLVATDTNGFVGIAITNGLETATVTNGLAPISYVDAATNGISSGFLSATVTNNGITTTTEGGLLLASGIATGYTQVLYNSLNKTGLFYQGSWALNPSTAVLQADIDLRLVATDTNGFVTITVTNGLGSGDGTLVATDTNGFVDVTVTNGLGSGDGTLVATDTNGFVDITITNGLGSGDGTLVATDTNGFVTITVTNGLGSGDGTLVATDTNGFVDATITNANAASIVVNAGNISTLSNKQYNLGWNFVDLTTNGGAEVEERWRLNALPPGDSFAGGWEMDIITNTTTGPGWKMVAIDWRTNRVDYTVLTAATPTAQDWRDLDAFLPQTPPRPKSGLLGSNYPFDGSNMTGMAAGTYTNTTIYVDSYGNITSIVSAAEAASGSSGGLTLIVSAYQGAAQTIPDASFTVMSNWTEQVDVGGVFNAASGAFTPAAGTTNLLAGGVAFPNMPDTKVVLCTVGTNGVNRVYDIGKGSSSATDGIYANGPAVTIIGDGSTSYYLVGYQSSGSPQASLYAQRQTRISIMRQQ